MGWDSGVSAIVVNYNSGHDLRTCVMSLVNQTGLNEIIVVDNGSSDESVSIATSAFPDIHVISNRVNDGFAGGANLGATAARSDVLLFLNPDVIVQPECVRALSDAIRESEGPVVCAPLIEAASVGLTEHGFTIDLLGDLLALELPGIPLYLSGCALAIGRGLFTNLGGFDSSYFMFCEDLDLCWRALLTGSRLSVVPEARVVHRGGGSTPGGYIRDGQIEVTTFRIALRERNGLATLIKCGPALWLIAVIPLRVVRMALACGMAVLFRRFDLAAALARGFSWDVARLPQLLDQRAKLRASNRMRRVILRERISHDVVSLQTLLRHGLPRFV
ncbi:MAG TPA: glycosyltransferase family 2 protein [Nitrospira sp.]|nr:glycosyltransferase family 2 protein [Nitrospira sp.]